MNYFNFHVYLTIYETIVVSPTSPFPLKKNYAEPCQLSISLSVLHMLQKTRIFSIIRGPYIFLIRPYLLVLVEIHNLMLILVN